MNKLDGEVWIKKAEKKWRKAEAGRVWDGKKSTTTNHGSRDNQQGTDTLVQQIRVRLLVRNRSSMTNDLQRWQGPITKITAKYELAFTTANQAGGIHSRPWQLGREFPIRGTQDSSQGGVSEYAM